MRHYSRFIMALNLLLCCTAIAQVSPGIPNFSAFDSHEIDTVNLMNNNVMLYIPVMSKAGALPFSFNLTGNYYMVSTNGVWQAGSTLLNSQLAGSSGFISPGVLYTNIGHPRTQCSNGVGSTTKYTNWAILGPDGTYHPLPVADFADTQAGGTSCLTGSGFTATTTDNSGLTATVTANATLSNVYNRSGILLTSTLIEDAQGIPNSIQLLGVPQYFQDSMGLKVLTPSGTGPGNTFTWTDVNGGNQADTVTTTSPKLKTAFGCGSIGDINNSFTTIMPGGVTFPDGTSLGITYESVSSGTITGRLATLTLREGGSVAYTYSGGTNGIDCTYQTVPLLKRTLGNGDVTTYLMAYALTSGSDYKLNNAVTDPGGNVTNYQFTGFTSTGRKSGAAQVLTQIVHYQGSITSGTYLSTDLYSYNAAYTSTPNALSISTTVVSYPISKRITYHQISGMTTWSAHEEHYDTYGNVTYLADYDFGASSPTRATTITYYQGGTSCGALSSGSNINDKPCEVSTVQGANTVADTKYTYDSHGNMLTTSMWTGSSWIGQTTANTYNTNGTPITTYDLANSLSTYTYDSSKYSDGCAGATEYPFPTKITRGSLSTSATYDCTGGVKLTDIDANGNTTTYGYKTSGGAADPYWRLNSVTDPYSLVVYRTYATGAPFVSSRSVTFNSNTSINSVTTSTDGYGRPVNWQKAQSPTGSNYDTVSTSYGWSGNYQQVQSSEPCSVGLGLTCGTVHTSKSDPLGRLYTKSTTMNETITNTYSQNDVLTALTPIPSGEHAKQTQSEYDGLKRIKSVCKIYAAGGGPDTCNQNTGSYSGVFDSYVYSSASGSTTVSVTRGSETRSKTFDALGRTTSTTIPEGNPSGATTILVYDTGGGCGSTHNGKLVALAHPRDGQCLFYDSLGRVTEIEAFISWPNFTACRWLYYDNSTGYTGTIPGGISVTNNLGRLVEAATDNCAGTHTTATLITDEWFSYDKNGRISDIWEKTPHSTQYYHSIATFFENGLVKTLQLASPLLYTMTYALDGEGRWKSLTDSTTAQNIVTGATFYPAANPAVVSLAGSDTDSYTFDVNTGNMTQFVFTVGSKNETGALTWNGNGTLKTLAITDGFNAGGTQTCHFNPNDASGTGYDDVMRLVGVDCGSGQWGQTFAYDQYDNLSKAAILGRIGSTYNPGYPTSAPFNNHCNICTYDSDGNVTSDGSNNYGWDEFAKLKWTATSGTPTCGSTGECITYDAFGRMVEDSSGGAYNEMWITQLGTIVQMAGTSPNYGYFPAPHGGMAIVNGNSGAYGYLHKDWLGNARIVSNIAAHGVTVDQAFSPYGEIYDQFGSNNSPYDMFATLTENFAPGVMWDTPNREQSVVGRWLSPDPSGEGWNQYGYPTNPNSQFDPTGLSTWVGNPYGSLGSISGYGSTAGFAFGIDSGPTSPWPSVSEDGLSWLFADFDPSKWIGNGQSSVTGSDPPPVVTLDSNGNVLCPGSCPGLAMIKSDASYVVNPQDGSAILFGGAAAVTTTTYDGPLVINSSGDISVQAVPGLGETIDLTIPAPSEGAVPSGTVSAGTPVVSGAVNFTGNGVTGATVSVGVVVSPETPYGINASVPVATSFWQTIGNALNSYASWCLEHGLD